MGQKIQRNCPVCASTYIADLTRLGHGRQTTCSRACSYTLRANEQREVVTADCATCGREFERPPSHIKGKHGANFCSPECHYRGRTLGLSKRVVTDPYTYTDAGMRKLSEAGALAYATGATLSHPKSEMNVLTALAEIGEQVIYQHVVKGEVRTYVVDFYLPQRGLVIELDGPEHGKSHVAQRDREVDAILTGQGIAVERVMLADPNEVRQAVFAALARNGRDERVITPRPLA